ncbi:O-antigen polymerase [Sphingobacterium chuzhouense]|uniref:Oligosaccharide repeat unit polymerase n=1 Tax=Sphingobacterium chuzhouense TaxID=1742264 RepID=A0ABR7XXH9_9SPHI|nr:O-antigen polymerase [Sphingobacterium chuzhouense]MBD1423774.1 oligosaccharide repeat unit polymerase [Sphingobacterium chuzhouense]
MTKVSLVIAIFSIFFSLVLGPKRIEAFDSALNITLTYLVILNIILFFNTVHKYYNTWLRYDVLFIIGFLIVHFQIPYLEAVGISPSRPQYIWINKFVVNYATWFSTLVILVWIIGFYMFLLKKGRKQIQPLNYKVEVNRVLYVILFISFIAFVGVVGQSFLSGNHAGADNWASGASYIFLILRAVLTILIIYFFINYKDRLGTKEKIAKAVFENKLLFFTAIAYCLLFLSVGDRGPIMQIGLTVLVGYSIYQKRISLSQLVLLLFVGAVFLTILKLGRTRDASTREGNVITEGYANLQSNENPFNPTEELASSVRILYRALDVVPDAHPYLNGASLISNVIDIIPMSAMVYNVPEMYRSSTLFFTIWGQGVNYTSGEGSEIIGDLYINLGFALTLVVFLFFGYFISFLTYNSLHRANHTLLLVYIVLIGGAIYINRSNFLNPAKFVLYAILLDALFARKIRI